MKKLILLLLIIGLIGCGTIISRTPGPMQTQNHAIYQGVKTDLRMLKADDDMGVAAALDVPLSLAADTFLLPLDLITWWARYTPSCQGGKCGL